MLRKDYLINKRWNLLSVSGRLEVMEELVDVSVVTDGGRKGNVSPKTNIRLHLKQAKNKNVISTVPTFHVRMLI